MFKKAVKIGAQNQLSGKDRKTIKSKLSQCFDEQCVEKILAENDKIISCKVSGSKMMIYNGNDYPIFVDGTGKHNYFPSLYIASAYQPLLKCLIINEGVESYIFNGANLMWPGVRDYSELGQFKKDQVVGIRSSKGELIAIGATGCGIKELQNMQGVAIHILHYKGDKLWDMGPKTYPQVIVAAQQPQPKVQQRKQEIPDAKVAESQEQKQQTKQSKKQQASQGKSKQQKQKQKKPEPTKQESEQQQSDSDDQDNFMNLVHSNTQNRSRPVQQEKKSNLKNAFVEDQNIENNKKGKKKGGKGGKDKKKQISEDQQEMSSEVEQKPVHVSKPEKVQNKKGKKKGGKGKGKGKKQESDKSAQNSDNDNQDKNDNKKQQPEKSAINSKLMDEYFKQSMLNAIKLSKVDAQLPMDSGKFFMDYMLLARPEGVKLDIKQSSYKKIGKFFDDMTKKKFIEYKHQKDKKIQGALINKIFWDNEQLKNYVPTINKLGSKQEDEKVQNNSKAKLKLSKTVQCETVHKPSEELFNLIFKKKLNLMPDESDEQVTDKQQIQYMTEKELREGIEKYINSVSENQKQAGKKTGKDVFIDHKKNKFIGQLLKSQIENYEENKQKDKILNPDSDQEEKNNKKNKNKNTKIKDMFKIDRQYLFDKLIKKSSAYYHLFDKETGLDKFKQGTFKGIQIIVQKSNNKNITKISGLQTFIVPKQEADDQMNGFANMLQTKFACSVNVQNLPGKNAGKEIIVHGAFLDQLEEIFQEQHQISEKFITTQNKIDKKKKH